MRVWLAAFRVYLLARKIHPSDLESRRKFVENNLPDALEKNKEDMRLLRLNGPWHSLWRLWYDVRG